METFEVVAVIDGNSLEVSPAWAFDGETGNLVWARGYVAPRTGKEALAAEQKLSVLIQNKKVELSSPQGIERGRLVCEVYFQGISLASYFPQYVEQDSKLPDTSEDQT